MKGKYCNVALLKNWKIKNFHIWVMDEDMVLKFCLSYLITTVHLSMNFHEKQIFIGWSLMG